MTLTQMVEFGMLLRKNTEASKFYDRCTPAQKQAIQSQLSNVQHMEAFVRHLPSAAL